MTPKFDALLAAQDIPSDAIQWIYVLFGRLLMHERKRDHWDVSIMFHGVAGSGKSTLLNCLKSYFHPQDVGYMQNSSWTDLEKKKLIVDPDVVILKSSKEDVKMYRSKNVILTTNNQYNPVKDVSNSFVVIHFPNQIKNPSPEFFKNLESELTSVNGSINAPFINMDISHH